MRTGVGKSLRNGKTGQKWESLLGYTVHDLMVHLERQFLHGMSWSNRDDWQIDHILPVVSFEFETQNDPGFKACWALTNLRPLWSDKNASKGAKRLYLV